MGKEYAMNVDPRTGRVSNCRSGTPRGWYSHDVDRAARFDGQVTVGDGYALEQYIAEESIDREQKGLRYQTFSDKLFIPVRDDWISEEYGYRYEQFENVTLPDANFDKAFEVP